MIPSTTNVINTEVINKKYVNIDKFIKSSLKITPRIIVPLIFGYYSLGVLYVYKVMQKIDEVAINIILHFGGYAAVGALMPTVQFWAAWTVRILSAGVGLIIYDYVERIVVYVVNKLFPQKDKKDLTTGSRNGNTSTYDDVNTTNSFHKAPPSTPATAAAA